MSEAWTISRLLHELHMREPDYVDDSLWWVMYEWAYPHDGDFPYKVFGGASERIDALVSAGLIAGREAVLALIAANPHPISTASFDAPSAAATRRRRTPRRKRCSARRAPDGER